jgi:hypothetical protein
MTKGNKIVFELPDTNLKPNHWRNRTTTGVINREKRVAYGCKITEDNIIFGKTRPRKKPVSYSEEFLYKNNTGNANIVKCVPTRSKSKTQSDLLLGDICNKIEKASKTKTKRTNKGNAKDKSVGPKSALSKPQKELEQAPREASSEAIKSSITIQEAEGEDLDKFVKSVLQKFGGQLTGLTLKKIATEYRGHHVPKAMRQFAALCLDIKHSFKNVKLHNFFCQMRLGVFDLEAAEFTSITEIAKDSNLYMIGSGDLVLAAKILDKNSDFEVVLIDDISDNSDERVIGPFRISQIVSELEIDDTPSEDSEHK